MKLPLCLLGAALTLAFSATAQTEKGTRTLGLSVSNFAIQPHERVSATNPLQHGAFRLGLLSSAGYFVADNLMLSARFSTDYQRQRDTPNADFTHIRRSITYGLGVSARYYIPSSRNGRFFGQANIDYQVGRHLERQKILNVSHGNRTTDTTIPVSVDLGYSHFVSPNVALEATVGYRFQGIGGYRAVGAPQASLGLRFFLKKPASTQP